MTTIIIPQHAIRAVSFAMGNKDIRHYLNGMLIEHNGAETRLIATDNSRIHAALIEHPGALITEPVSVIIPRAMVETIVKAKAPRQQKTAATVTINFADPQHGIDETGKPTVTMPVKASALLPDGTETVAALVDGRYPDYQRIIPSGFSGETANYNPGYLVDAHAGLLAWFDLGKGKFPGIGFAQNGTGVGGYSVPGFVALVMPMRAEPCAGVDGRFANCMEKPAALPEVTVTMSTEVAAWLDPTGGLQDAGLVKVAA